MPPAQRVLCCVVLNVPCQHHRASSSIRGPVASNRFASLAGTDLLSSITGGSHPDYSQSRRMSDPNPRIQTLTTPAAAQKLQLRPEFQVGGSVSQDPSDTKTSTGPGMQVSTGHGSEPTTHHTDLQFSLRRGVKRTA